MDTPVQITQHTKTGVPTVVGLTLTAAFGAIGLAALLLVSSQPQDEWQNYLTRMPGNQATAGTSLENTNAGLDTNTNSSAANLNTNDSVN